MKHEYQKGDLQYFPIEVIERMLDCQVEQGNPRDVTVFQECANIHGLDGGFSWIFTTEGAEFWNSVLNEKNFDLFFDRYPYTPLLRAIYLAEGYNEHAVQEMLNEAEIINSKHRYAGGEVLMVVHCNLTVDFFKIGENNSLTLINVK